MLDSDLARLYHCSNGTKTINQAVKRHINRFPERFMFQLTKEEMLTFNWFQFETGSDKKKYLNDLNRSQVGTANINSMSRSLPYVFTEQGVAMLATILRTSVAEEISIQIMDVFVSMRKYISSNLLEQKYINNQVMKNSEDIKLLQESFNKFNEKEKNNHIFFEGQIYDAYSKIIDIFNMSKENIIIIDNYLDKNMLDIISKAKVNVTLITADKLDNIDLFKYQKQYNNLIIK